MGCTSSSNTVAPVTKYQPILYANHHRNTPVQIITSSPIKQQLKHPTFKAQNTQITQKKISFKAVSPQKIDQKIAIESRRSVEEVLPEKQNVSAHIFNTIPDCSPTTLKNAPSRPRAKKIKKHLQNPMQKELKRLYGL